jgi:hypothetical protein
MLGFSSVNQSFKSRGESATMALLSGIKTSQKAGDSREKPQAKGEQTSRHQQAEKGRLV